MNFGFIETYFIETCFNKEYSIENSPREIKLMLLAMSIRRTALPRQLPGLINSNPSNSQKDRKRLYPGAIPDTAFFSYLSPVSKEACGASPGFRIEIF